MRIALLDQNVAIESAHLLDCEDADAAEGSGSDRKDLALCDVCAKDVVRGALQTIEGDLTRLEVALEGSVGNLDRKIPCHDLLVLHLCVAQSAGAGVAAVEAHEGIGMLVIELVLDGLFVHVSRYGVVDVKQGDLFTGNAGADELGQSAVYVDLTGYRDTASGQAAVDIAGNELELCLECRPALSCDTYIISVTLVSLYPVKQGQFILCKSLQDLRLLVACSKFLLHIRDNFRNSRVAGMIVEGLEQIELGVLFDLNAKVVELLDRSVACKEIVRSRSEGDELQSGQTIDGACDRKELMDHIRALSGCSYRILRNISLYAAQSQVVAGVQHTAVSVSASVLQIILGFLSCRAEHLRSFEVLCKQGLGDLRPEVSKINDQRVAACLLDVFKGLDHMDLTLDDTYRTLIDVIGVVLCLVRIDQCFSSVDRERCREAVTAHSNDTNLCLRDVVKHVSYLLYYLSFRFSMYTPRRPSRTALPGVTFLSFPSLECDVLSDQSHRASLRKASLRMSDQPFVLGCQMRVLAAGMRFLKVIVRSPRKNDDYTEALAARIAGSIVERSREDLHCRSLRSVEHLAGRRVKRILICHVSLAGKDQIEIGGSDIDLGTSVILQGVQLIVVSVAVADLDRKLSVGHSAKILAYRDLLKLRIAGDIDDVIRAGRFLHPLQKLTEIDSFDDPSVLPEFGICYLIDLHGLFPLPVYAVHWICGKTSFRAG